MASTDALLAAVIEYLHRSLVPFELVSLPQPEPKPNIAVPLRAGTLRLRTTIVLTGESPALAVHPESETASVVRLAQAIDEIALEGTPMDLLGPYQDAPEPIPPLGRLLGVPVLLDDQAMSFEHVAFGAFSAGDVITMALDDFLSLEAPKVASFISAGELPSHA